MSKFEPKVDYDGAIEKIRKLMWRKAVYREQIMNYLNLSHSGISLKMNGKRQFTIEELGNLSLYFEVSLDWLIGLSSNQRRLK